MEFPPQKMLTDTHISIISMSGEELSLFVGFSLALNSVLIYIVLYLESLPCSSLVYMVLLFDVTIYIFNSYMFHMNFSVRFAITPLQP